MTETTTGTQRLPVTLLTGFLGSGKTTVLNALLRQRAPTGIAVVINELGEIGIDHDLVERTEESFTLVRNGCVCCTVRDDLISTLRELSERRQRGDLPALAGVVLETTGMADPAPIIHTLMNDEAMRADYGLGAVVATVDAVNGARTLDAHIEAVKQAGIADLILLTKTDIADAATTAALKQRLAALNPGAPQLDAVAGRIDPTRFLASGHFSIAGKSDAVAAWLNAEAVAAHEAQAHEAGGAHVHQGPQAHHGAHDNSRHDMRISSYCITRDRPISWSGFSAWLEMVGAMRGNDLLRVKGIVNVAEHPDQPLVIHGVQHIFHPPVKLAGWPSSDRRTRIVFITRNIDKAAIDDTLSVFEHRSTRRRKPG
jgi:G3E family GTPase